jgi:putative ABC transport system ATP-binding protein
MTQLIKMEGVTKIFRTEDVETHALSNIDLTIDRGDYVSIAGPSGCGKSTLLSVLGLLDSPTSGKYFLNGKDVSQITPAERTRIRNREIGFVFQAFNLIGDLTVYENVELPLTYRNMGAAERKEKTEHALERVGMSHRKKHFPAQLSGGQQQRVAVARALVSRPSVMFADEPTGNLDSTTGGEILALLRDSVDTLGQTTVMVTHDAHAAAIADRVLFLADGRIVCDLGRSTAHTILDTLEAVTAR